MNKLIEIRNQEMMCRERALSDIERRDLWLAKAEEWAQRALDEIAFQFRESSSAKASKPKPHIAKAPTREQAINARGEC